MMGRWKKMARLKRNDHSAKDIIPAQNAQSVKCKARYDIELISKLVKRHAWGVSNPSMAPEEEVRHDNIVEDEDNGVKMASTTAVASQPCRTQ